MREVKYKVNNGFTRNFICKAVMPTIFNDELYCYWCEDENKWKPCRDVREYTGLKDKNGVEIYEGDVLIANYGKSKNKGKVFWVDRKGFCFGKEGWYSEMNYWGNVYDNLNIIGNIYENPELLK